MAGNELLPYLAYAGMTKRSRSYGKLNYMPAWGLYDGSKLVATIKAPNELAATQLFIIHNERQPEHRIKGDRVVKLAKN